ncbi:MAG: calcium-binding protein [Microbacteriaceae bacterium]|nr:calcium-binding protein [Microbacteriaceae bacterium]
MKRTFSLLFSLVLASALLVPASPASAASESDCTIVGTKKADTLSGTNGPDVICAGAGSDTIYGMGGDDIIRAGSGNDIILAGAGKDTVFGESGNDNIAGSDGADQISGGDGKDRITGGGGQDLIQGGTGTDNLSAGNGNDLIDGGLGTDTISTGAGNDMCNADEADVRLDACTLDSKGPTFGATTTEWKQFAAGNMAVFGINVSDDAGVQAVYGSIGGAPGWVTEWCGFLIPIELASGTQKAGTYKLSCTIPPNAVNAKYTLFLSAVDLMGHASRQELEFEVFGGSEDNQTPEIKNIAIPETVVADQTFTIKVAATDDSGVAGIWMWLLLEGGGFSNERGIYAQGSEPRTNFYTPVDCIVEQDFVFDSLDPLGTYRVWISKRDAVGNREFVDSGQTVTLTK